MYDKIVMVNTADDAVFSPEMLLKSNADKT